MSGDVQPRKRKDKRRKKDDEEFSHHHGSIGGSDEIIHIHKENKLGGNICSKIVFFGLLGALGIMVGFILIEYHGTSDVDTNSAPGSPWSVILEDWVDNSPASHDHNDHESNMEHSQEEEEDHDEHKDHGISKKNNYRPLIDEKDEECITENSGEDLSKEYDNLGSSDNEKSKEICKDLNEDVESGEEKFEEGELEGKEDEEEEEIVDDEEDNEGEDEENSEESELEESEEEIEDETEEEENEVEEEIVSEEEEIDEGEEQSYINTKDNCEEDTRKHYKRDFKQEEDSKVNNEDNAEDNFQLSRGLLKHKKRTIDLFESKQRKLYISEIIKKLKKEEKTPKKPKHVFKLHKKEILQEKYEDIEESLDRKNMEKYYKIGEEENNIDEDDPLIDDDSRDTDEDETSGVALKFGVGIALVFVAHVVLIRRWSEGGEDLKHTTNDEPESADVPPSFVERRQTLIPTEIMEDFQAITHPQEDGFSEDEHADEIEEVEDVVFVKQTYEDLRAAYNHSTPDGSDVELTEDTNIKTEEYGSTESEQDRTEQEDEDDEDNSLQEDDLEEDDPLGQWKSVSGPEILAEEVEDVQTGSETEESDQEELRVSGPKSKEIEDEVYDNADITNQADWDIREELDEADRDLDDRAFPV